MFPIEPANARHSSCMAWLCSRLIAASIFTFSYIPMHDVAPSAVSTAEIIEARICSDHLSVSFLVIRFSFFLFWHGFHGFSRLFSPYSPVPLKESRVNPCLKFNVSSLDQGAALGSGAKVEPAGLGSGAKVQSLATLLWGLTPASTAHLTLLWGLTPATTYGFTGPSPASSLTGPSPVSEPVVEPPSFSGSSTVPGSAEVTRFTSSPLRS